jgi:hypothetical protein
MSTGYRIDDQFGTCFLTLSVVDWFDISTRSRYRDITIDSFNYCIRENRQQLDYIHKNPVRAGWVEREEDYTYSSAVALYNGQKGQIPLEVW